MDGYFLFLPAAVILAVLFLTGSLFAGVFIVVTQRLKSFRLKKFVLGRYNAYYITEEDILNDDRARKMIPIISRGYGYGLEEYMSQISEDRLPPCVVLNWVRSIAEDVTNSALPALKVKKWHDFIVKSAGEHFVIKNTDFIELERYEECYIWGCVNRWLELYEPAIMNEELRESIYRTACPKKYLKPYFDITFMTQEEKRDLLNGLFQGASLNNTQINVVVENGSSVSFYGSEKASRIHASDEQIAMALERLNGKGKAIDSQRAWLGACLLLGYKYNFPRNLGDCCKKIGTLPIDIDALEFRCDYESIRRYGSWKFVKEKYDDWVDYTPRDDERTVFEKSLSVAQALDSEIEKLCKGEM